MELLLSPEVWLAFFTLAALEIVLGIDNIVFITILTTRLPPEQQTLARNLGLMLAMVMRIALLLALSWIMGLTSDLFVVLGNGISWRDLILIVGGAFLIGKATMEVHNSLEAEEDHAGATGRATLLMVLVQIGLVDMVFSLDSVITAIGLVEHVPVMVAAIIFSVIVMMAAAGPIARVVQAHPTLKMLALSFLILIGMALVGEGFGVRIPKGYIYFAMAFSVIVELLNIRVRAKRKRSPVKLHRSQLRGIVLKTEDGRPDEGARLRSTDPDDRAKGDLET